MDGMSKLLNIYYRIMKKYKRILYIDYETRSERDILDVGSHRYLTDATTEMILVSWAFDKDETQVSETMPEGVVTAIEDPDVLKIAHNAEFDMGVCVYLLGINVDCRDWVDTAYIAAYYGYPRSLKNLTRVLNTQLKASQEELFIFAIPRERARTEAPDELFFRPTPTIWNDKTTHPADWDAFLLYAKGDVDVMREAYIRMPSLPDIEIFTMQITFEMNFNGVPFDVEFAKEIYQLSQDYSERAGVIAQEKYSIDNLRSTKQVQLALMHEGIYLGSLNVKERGGVTHEILDLRDQATGTAFSKIPTALNRICPDGRLHGEFVGHGAHTGRWSSRGVQLQNFARIKSEVCDDLSLVRNYSHLRQHMRLTIGNLKDHKFTCADLSQIEARIVAWLAQCEWRMNAFKNGEDIYARSAERMFGKPKITKDDPERQDGKCSELGFGYGGGANAILRINPDFFHAKGAAKVQQLVDTWRLANPEICRLWRKLESGFRQAMKDGMCNVMCGTTKLVFKFDGSTAAITLPSGRSLYYRSVSLVYTSRGSDLYYLDYSRGGDSPAQRIKFWGGTILENVTQAIARDILVGIMQRVKRRDERLQCIGTVHDEIWYLTHETIDINPLTLLLEEMARPIEWASGLITCGEGFTHKRYIK